jgi:transcription antitermination factor NusG
MTYFEPKLYWYALQVRPRHEDIVAELLRYKGYEEYLPKYVAQKTRRTSSTSERNLFPGYVFCRFKYNETGQAWSGASVVTTPGVVKILGGKQPDPGLANEIEAIKRILAAKLTPEPWPFLQAGQTVEIEAGPLRGLWGTVLSAQGTHRLIVSVELLQRSVAVEISPSWLYPELDVRKGSARFYA